MHYSLHCIRYHGYLITFQLSGQAVSAKCHRSIDIEVGTLKLIVRFLLFVLFQTDVVDVVVMYSYFDDGRPMYFELRWRYMRL